MMMMMMMMIMMISLNCSVTASIVNYGPIAASATQVERYARLYAYELLPYKIMFERTQSLSNASLYQVAQLGAILCVNFVILLRPKLCIPKLCIKFEWSAVIGPEVIRGYKINNLVTSP